MLRVSILVLGNLTTKMYFWNIFTLIISLLHLTVAEDVAFNATVAKDGSGNYKTVSQAILASPDNNSRMYYIYILEGIYEENIVIGVNKVNLVLVGQGIDKTIISGNRSSGSGFKTSDTATAVVLGNGFTGKDITFQNTAGPENHQAVALRSEANQLSFFRCSFKGYQDTLYAKYGRQFYRDCDIYGTVDFIFGDATVLLQNSRILVHKPLVGQSNTISAQKRDRSTSPTGTVIHNCTIVAAADLKQESPRARTYLGRPWANFSRTIVMESYLDDLLDPQGWLEWEPQTTNTVFYAEFRNRGPGADTSKRVPWSKVIRSSTDAAIFTVKNFIHGETWIPKDIPFVSGLIE